MNTSVNLIVQAFINGPSLCYHKIGLLTSGDTYEKLRCRVPHFYNFDDCQVTHFYGTRLIKFFLYQSTLICEWDKSNQRKLFDIQFEMKNFFKLYMCLCFCYL